MMLLTLIDECAINQTLKPEAKACQRLFFDEADQNQGRDHEQQGHIQPDKSDQQVNEMIEGHHRGSTLS
jgi:hypothetical protein